MQALAAIFTFTFLESSACDCSLTHHGCLVAVGSFAPELLEIEHNLIFLLGSLRPEI